MARRYFVYVYSLIYPAVLGSFLFAAITRRGLSGEQAWAALVMGAYFLIQYGEGIVAAQPLSDNTYHYGPARFVQDLLEIVAVIAVFAALGFFAGDSTEDAASSWLVFLAGQHWGPMIVAFLIPPIGRYLRMLCPKWFGDLSDRDKIIWTWWLPALSAWSMIAILGCLVGMFYPFIGLAVITVTLGLYVTLYVIKAPRGAG